MTREQYIEETLNRANIAESESFRAKYWELAGRAMGYLEPEQVQNQNIAIFQTISNDMISFLKDKKLLEVEIPNRLTQSSTENTSTQQDNSSTRNLNG